MTRHAPHIRLGHYLTALVAVLLATATAIALLAVAHGLPSFGSPYRLTAVLPTAENLTSGSRVTMAGVTVGRVTSTTPVGLGARVGIVFDTGAVTPLPADSRVTLSTRTAVGEAYLQITPGHSRAMLPSGSVLGVQQANPYVDVDQILSIVQGDTTPRTRAMFRGLAAGLGGRGDELNALLGAANGALTHGPQLTLTLNAQRSHLGRLVAQLGLLAQALGQRSTAITTLVDAGERTISAVSSQDASVRATIERLPAALDQVRTTMGVLGHAAAIATPVVQNLAVAVSALGPVATQLEPAAFDARGLLGQVDVTAPRLTQTLPRLRSLEAPARTTLPALRKALCAVNPMLRYTEPYTEDIVNVITGLGSASNLFDSISHTVRIAPVINERALAGAPAPVLEAARALLHSGLLGEVTPLEYNPYPGPGQAGTGATGPSAVQSPAGVKASGYVFPRLHADC